MEYNFILVRPGFSPYLQALAGLARPDWAAQPHSIHWPSLMH